MILPAATWGQSAVVLPGPADTTGSTVVVGGSPPAASSLYLNDLVGATTFYDAGYTGTRAVVANVEAGHIWPGHETLTHVTTQIDAGPPTINAQIDQHATMVGSLIAGRPVQADSASVQDEQRGIAYGATLWSGAIATTMASNGSFTRSPASTLFPYNTVFATGIDRRTADVVNSSWGFTDGTGSSFTGMALDGLAYMNPGTTFVVAAGNSGPNANTVGGPASAYNNITVAALSAASGYTAVASFSSRGPSTYADPVNGTLPNPVRAAVDLSAPGETIKGAYYGGTTGSNTGGTDITGGADNIYIKSSGTSFAAPIVAGAAALVVDAAYAQFPADTSSRDSRVVKAVLMNSADKTTGWNNGQADVGGVITTTQSLDYATGAGALNLDRAFTQFLSGTTGVPGDGAGTVAHVGWDLGVVSEGTPSDYSIAYTLGGGTRFDATLVWNRERYLDYSQQVAYDVGQDNLDLQVWSTDNGIPTTLIAESISEYNNVEHLSFLLPDTDTYLLRVLWAGELFDLSQDVNSTSFALAWSSSAIPEASTLAAGALILAGALVPRFRRRGGRPADGASLPR